MNIGHGIIKWKILGYLIGSIAIASNFVVFFGNEMGNEIIEKYDYIIASKLFIKYIV